MPGRAGSDDSDTDELLRGFSDSDDVGLARADKSDFDALALNNGGAVNAYSKQNIMTCRFVLRYLGIEEGAQDRLVMATGVCTPKQDHGSCPRCWDGARRAIHECCQMQFRSVANDTVIFSRVLNLTLRPPAADDTASNNIRNTDVNLDD